MTELKVITYFFGKILTAVISLAIIPLFINWYGEVKYGEYILIYTTFLIFISGSMGWINQSMIKYHGDYKENRKEFYDKVHYLSYQIAVLVSIPLLVIIYFSNKENTFLLLLFVAIGFIVACRYTSKLFENQSELKPLNFTIAEIIRLLMFLGFVFILRKTTFFNGLESIFFSLTLSYFCAYIYINKGIKTGDFKIDLNFDFTLIKKFLAFGLPLSVWMMLSPSSNGIDRYILNYYLGAGVLAQYTAVYDVIFKIFTQLANPINSVYQPLLMKINSSGDEVLFNKIMLRAFVYLSLLCAPVFIIVYLFQDVILVDYLGFTNQETLKELKQIIMPLAFSGFIWQIAIIAQKRLEAKEKTFNMAVVMFAVIVVFSVFTAILVPQYGFLAASYTSILSGVFYLVIISLINRHENKKRNSAR